MAEVADGDDVAKIAKIHGPNVIGVAYRLKRDNRLDQ
jgi:hypothetical protein